MQTDSTNAPITQPTTSRRSRRTFDLDAESIAGGQQTRPEPGTRPGPARPDVVVSAAGEHQSDSGWPGSLTQREIANLSS